MSGRIGSAVHALGRNLAAGLRLALFMPVDRMAFRITPVQLLLVVIVSAAIDIDADWIRAGQDARFSILGLHGEIFALGLLVLTSVVLAIVRRDNELYLALPLVVLASFPAIQVAHVLPDLPQVHPTIPGRVRETIDYVLFAWMLLLAMRAVHICTDPARPHRRAWAVAGGILLIAPIWFAPLIGPLDPWWRDRESAEAADAVSPASEAVLAAQRFMLDRELDALEDERPGVTDIYFVGFAPDARNAGFLTDVDLAQRAMDERWDTSGRSLVLVNSPQTVAERPFATITHLREVLLEIGDIIDPDDDIVMVYLTGTMGRDQTLNAVNPPLDLVALSPQGLKQLFEAAGIRWKIVVVSACQSGAWVDALRDDETLVIASSAANARSTDCEGGVRPSEFAQAFFVDAMRHNEDITQAFDAARRRLADAHAATPVMAMGPAIAERLKMMRQRANTRAAAAFDVR